MKAFLPIVLAMLLVSCGRKPDPPFVNQSGDFGGFLMTAIASSRQQPAISNHLATSWFSRILTDRHRSGEHLDGRQALQVETAKTNFVFVESLLTQQFGAPAMPLRQENGWRHVGWSRPDQKLGVWLIEDEDQCRVEIVTEPSMVKP